VPSMKAGWNPQRYLIAAVVASAALSFVAGEAVGAKLAVAGQGGARRGVAASSVASSTEEALFPARAAEAPVATEIGPDCNTNYR
jgi:hypothetical protein